MTDELSADAYETIKEYCEDGDALAADGKLREAIVEYNKAWALLPAPKDHWGASTWRSA